MTRRIRAAIVGSGMIARVHARAVRAAGGEVAGVLGSRPGRAATLAAEWDAAEYDALDDLLAADVDVVHVCTPNATHADYSSAALAADKHVVCEKPLATTAEDAARLVELARASGLVATVPFVYRYHPIVRELRARRIAGEFGRWNALHGSYTQDWLLSSDAGNWRVDSAEGGAANVVVSQVAPGRRNRLWFELNGLTRSAVFDQEQPETAWVGDVDGARVIARGTGRLSADQARLDYVPAGHAQGYQDCFNAFVADTYAAIGGARPEGLPDFADGLRATRIVDAVIASAATRNWVDVEGDRA